MNFKFLSLSLLMAFSNFVPASDAVGPGDSESRLLFGVGIGTVNNNYAGETDIHNVFPRFQYNGEYFFIKDNSLNLYMLGYKQWSTGLTVGWTSSFLSDRGRYEDNPRLIGLIERENTFESGFYINHSTAAGRLSFQLMKDVGGKHDGGDAVLKYTGDFMLGNWFINPVVGVEWVSDDKVDANYGVSVAEATISREVYKGDDAYNMFVGIRARYELTQHWDFDFNAGVKHLDSGITDSSIVDDSTIYRTAFSLNYNF